MGQQSDNEVEAAQIDMINKHLIDVKKEYNDTNKLGEEAVANWFQAKLPEWMGKLEKFVCGKGFAVGSKVTWADVELFTFLTGYFDNKEGAEASIQACPKIKNSAALIKNLPAMRAHLAKKAAKAS